MSEVLDNILAKYRAFGFDPPLHPDKYLVPISINEFTEVVNGVHQLKCQLAEAEKVIEFYADKYKKIDVIDSSTERLALEEMERCQQAINYFKNKEGRNE